METIEEISSNNTPDFEARTTINFFKLIAQSINETVNDFPDAFKKEYSQEDYKKMQKNANRLISYGAEMLKYLNDNQK